MDNLAGELAELKGFIADLKADRAAQKEKEKREGWTKYTSISVVFIAVLAAVASQWAGKYSGRMMVELNDATFHQAEATDQWSYYQANSVKGNLYESIQEMAPKDSGAADAGKAQAAFKAKIDKYEAGKKDSKEKAETLEKERDRARASAADAARHGGGMGLAVAVFQISIAVASICLVTKKKWLWHASLLLALVATGRMLWVWVN